MILPTTKPKQRQFIDTLIDQINHGLSRSDILKYLRVLRSQMRNRKPVKKGAPVAQTVTPAIRRQVVAMWRRNPRITNQRIADRLNLNGGRVSEILAGKRR